MNESAHQTTTTTFEIIIGAIIEIGVTDRKVIVVLMVMVVGIVVGEKRDTYLCLCVGWWWSYKGGRAGWASRWWWWWCLWYNYKVSLSIYNAARIWLAYGCVE